MRTPKNWSRVSLGHPKFGTGCPLEIWLGCQIYGLLQGLKKSSPWNSGLWSKRTDTPSGLNGRGNMPVKQGDPVTRRIAGPGSWAVRMSTWSLTFYSHGKPPRPLNSWVIGAPQPTCLWPMKGCLPLGGTRHSTTFIHCGARNTELEGRNCTFRCLVGMKV